jgi:hypothetical protein
MTLRCIHAMGWGTATTIWPVDKSHNQQCRKYSFMSVLSMSFAGAKLIIRGRKSFVAETCSRRKWKTCRSTQTDSSNNQDQVTVRRDECWLGLLSTSSTNEHFLIGTGEKTDGLSPPCAVRAGGLAATPALVAVPLHRRPLRQR